ncbi:alpha/beta hydrolase [Amycolatopsis jiangsuensis]
MLAPPADAASADAAGYAPAPIDWGPCTSGRLAGAGAECGFLVVPLDYARPGGETVRIAVSRVKHTAAQYQGVMLVNPGGPGGSGLGLSTLGRSVPDHAGDGYDWIGFDPRGVGASEPAITCDGGYASYDRPQYVPSVPGAEQAWRAKAKGYADACAGNGAILDHVKTTDVAQDLESLRKALGETRINYYGFSYGTYLGQVYSTLYPDHVRRMVLDGNVDPRKVWYRSNLDQEVAFDRAIKEYFSWLAKYDDLYHLGGTETEVEKLWYEQRARLDRSAAGGVIGGDEWTDVFLQAGYYVFGWEEMAEAFDGWVHRGDWKPLKDLYDQTNPPGDDNSYAVYASVECTDAPWPRNWNRWRFDAWRTHLRAPFETWGNTWFNAPCADWPAKAARPVHVDGGKVGGILLISEELDAATPYAGSLEVRGMFPRSSLISAPGGTTHAGSLSGVACVDDKVAAYLASGTLPKRTEGTGSDAQCEPVPPPVPKAAGARQKADSAARQPHQRVLAGLPRS